MSSQQVYMSSTCHVSESLSSDVGAGAPGCVIPKYGYIVSYAAIGAWCCGNKHALELVELTFIGSFASREKLQE